MMNSDFKYICAQFSAFLVLDFGKVVFRSFNYVSIDMRTESVLLAVWQLAAFKDDLSKY